MVNERERDAVSDVIIIVDSRAVAETGPVSRNALVYPLGPLLRWPSTSLVAATRSVSSSTAMRWLALTETQERSNST